MIASRPSLVLSAKTVLKAIDQAASAPEMCEPLLRASNGSLKLLMASLGPNASLPPDILEALTSLCAFSSQRGLLRHDNLRISGLAQKDFAALFGFASLDKALEFAEDVEELVQWKSFPITNGAEREAALRDLDEKVREYNATPAASVNGNQKKKYKAHYRLKNRELTQIDTILLGLFLLRTGAHQSIASLLFDISQTTTSVYFQASLELIVLHSERQAVVIKKISQLPKNQRKQFNTGNLPSDPDPADLPDYVCLHYRRH